MTLVNTLRPRQDGRHFADDIFKYIFLNENVSIAIKISLKFVPKGPINNNLALVQIIAWRRPGDKPLSEPMMVSLPTHICVTRPQWVKSYSIKCKSPASRLLAQRFVQAQGTSKLRVTGLCEGNSPKTGRFPSQRTSNAENITIWWRHHVFSYGWSRPVANHNKTQQHEYFFFFFFFGGGTYSTWLHTLCWKYAVRSLI